MRSPEEKEEIIQNLEEDIGIEEMQYQTCLEHQTDTAQFIAGQAKHRKKIDAMIEELNDLKTK